MIERPLQSLSEGHWFKLICGASYQHLPAIRNLSLAYTLAGADCIDVAPDPAVIAAARSGIAAAVSWAAQDASGQPSTSTAPWLMVSLNAGEDPHFRKATFDPQACPPSCGQPCVTICPAQAIAFPHPTGESGVQADRCYGCGRCLPICPIDHIATHAQSASPTLILPLIHAGDVNALEIHTHVGQFDAFRALWEQIAEGLQHLKVLAISCPEGADLLGYLTTLYEFIAPLPCPLIWQVDGRSMSGDIGKGTTIATVRLGMKVLKSQLPGYVQLAGGTNDYTVTKLKALGLLKSWQLHAQQRPEPHDQGAVRYIAGVAYGSYARCLVEPILQPLDVSPSGAVGLEQSPDVLRQAVELAGGLVAQLKALPTESPPLAAGG